MEEAGYRVTSSQHARTMIHERPARTNPLADDRRSPLASRRAPGGPRSRSHPAAALVPSIAASTAIPRPAAPPICCAPSPRRAPSPSRPRRVTGHQRPGSPPSPHPCRRRSSRHRRPPTSRCISSAPTRPVSASDLPMWNWQPLRIFSVRSETSESRLLWVETYRGQPDLPGPQSSADSPASSSPPWPETSRTVAPAPPSPATPATPPSSP